MTVSVNKLDKDIISDDGKELTPGIHFDHLFEENWVRVSEVIFRIVGDQHEAEDLTLEVFWRLYRRFPRKMDNIPGWLYRVATNLGLNALRSRKRRQRYENEAGRFLNDTSLSTNPEMELVHTEEREKVHRILANLKPRMVKLLVLRHSGFSYKEIATIVGVSPSSVGTLLARAERDFERFYIKESDETSN